MNYLKKSNKKSLQIKLTVFVGFVLLISSSLLVMLLNYSLSLSLDNISIPIDGMIIDIYSVDNFSENIIMYGFLIATITTITGTFLTYFILGKFLLPLKKLSNHMNTVDKHNLTENINLKSTTREVEILINSFNYMLDKLRNSFDMQKDFSSYIAHEIRTPISVIQTKIDVFMKKKQSEKDTEKLISELDIQIEKLNNLVSKIIELANVQRVELSETIPLGILFEELFQDLEETAKKKDIDMVLSFENEINIIGNHVLLYRGFFNILENAIKYNDVGGKINVSLEEKYDCINISINDTGCGIIAGDENNIFKPFFRSKSKSKGVEGIGMGLAFSKKVFEHHGAEVRAAKNYPKGSKFEIILRK